MVTRITETFEAQSRDAWRQWLEGHHDRTTEIWLLYAGRRKAVVAPTLTYLDSVEEAICFGWIDGIAKKHPSGLVAQRFTPRGVKSHWTELNKERARRLIRLGLMTAAGSAALPDLDPAAFKPPADILAAIERDAQAWLHWRGFPDLYRRVRLSYVDEIRRGTAEFSRRLENLLKKTRAGVMFGNWNDSTLPVTRKTS